MNFVATDDPDDLEVGACVFSLTLQDSNGWRGGSVLEVRRDDDGAVTGVTCVEWFNGQPRLVEIVRDDLDMPTARFYAQEARTSAAQVSRWLAGRHAPKDPANLARWYGWAAALAQAGAVGLYLPGAERRYQRTRRLEREGRGW